jgi:hypothetical protein
METNYMSIFNNPRPTGRWKLEKPVINDKTLKLFFDTEFTGLHKDTTLISIGITSFYGDVFYAEFTDYDKSMVDNWINDNVVKHLCLTSDTEINVTEYKQYVRGSKQYVREKLLQWLDLIHKTYLTAGCENIQFVSDVSHYDFTLLIDLMGKDAFSIPNYVCPSCHDINQDIATCFDITDVEAFDKNREESLITLINSSKRYINEPIKITMIDEDIEFIKNNNIKHNALWDAIIILMLYQYMCHIPNHIITMDTTPFKDLGLI